MTLDKGRSGAYEWESRRDGELTTVYLGRVLDWLGLADMARRARDGHYDDFFAPREVADGLEILRLYNELRAAARTMQASGQRRAPAPYALRRRGRQGWRVRRDQRGVRPLGGEQGRPGHHARPHGAARRMTAGISA